MRKSHISLLAIMLLASTQLSIATTVTVKDDSIAQLSDFAPIVDKSKDTLVVIQFHTVRCNPCNQMSRELKNFVKLLTATDQQPVYVSRILIANSKHPLHNNRLVPGTNGQAVKQFPTMVIIKNGVVVWRKTGVTKAKDLLNIVTTQNFTS